MLVEILSHPGHDYQGGLHWRQLDIPHDLMFVMFIVIRKQDWNSVKKKVGKGLIEVEKDDY